MGYFTSAEAFNMVFTMNDEILHVVIIIGLLMFHCNHIVFLTGLQTNYSLEVV